MTLQFACFLLTSMREADVILSNMLTLPTIVYIAALWPFLVNIIFVLCIQDGQDKHLEPETCCSVEKVKALICSKEGIPPVKQHLIFYCEDYWRWSLALQCKGFFPLPISFASSMFSKSHGRLYGVES